MGVKKLNMYRKQAPSLTGCKYDSKLYRWMRREDWKVVQLRVTEGASQGEQDFLILKS